MQKNAGFTLIEMLVIIAILTVFSGILISYNKDSGRQMLLVANQAKLVSLISRAKSLSISTFLDSSASPALGDPITCSIGVHVNRSSGEVFIFRDLATDCSLLADNKYTGDSEKAGLLGELNTFKLDSKIVEFTPPAADDLNDIVFIPPDPQILINNDQNKLDAQVGIKIKDSSTSKIIIKVNNAGQISTK